MYGYESFFLFFLVDRITLQFNDIDIEESQSSQGSGDGLCIHDSVRVS